MIVWSISIFAQLITLTLFPSPTFTCHSFSFSLALLVIAPLPPLHSVGTTYNLLLLQPHTVPFYSIPDSVGGLFPHSFRFPVLPPPPPPLRILMLFNTLKKTQSNIPLASNGTFLPTITSIVCTVQ